MTNISDKPAEIYKCKTSNGELKTQQLIT